MITNYKTRLQFIIAKINFCDRFKQMFVYNWQFSVIFIGGEKSLQTFYIAPHLMQTRIFNATQSLNSPVIVDINLIK